MKTKRITKDQHRQLIVVYTYDGTETREAIIEDGIAFVKGDKPVTHLRSATLQNLRELGLDAHEWGILVTP